MKAKPSQRPVIIVKLPDEPRKNFIERNPSLWNFLSSLVGIGALVVSIFVMTDSSRTSKINFDNFERQVRAENQRRFDDSSSARAKEIRDSINFARQDSVNILTLEAFTAQAKAANDALRQQKFNIDLKTNVDRPVLSVDSVYCLKRTGGYVFALNLSNIGGRELKTIRSIFFIVNIPKDFCTGSFSDDHETRFPNKGFAVSLNRLVPDSIMSDPYTSLFIKIDYLDELLRRNETLLKNYYWEEVYQQMSNLNVMNNTSPILVKTIKTFINKKVNSKMVR